MHNKPKLIIVTGRPGAGKTTLSKKLGELLHLPVVSRDEIKEGYVNTVNVRHDELPENTNKAASEVFFKTIELLLTNNVSMIAEAAFQHKVWEPKITRFKEYADVVVIICEVDAEVAAKRHLEQSGRVLRAAEYDPPSLEVSTIRVCTLNGYDPELAEIELFATKRHKKD